MRWSVTHGDEMVAIDELYYRASDRAVGIVVGSIIEMRVTALLKDAMIKDSVLGRSVHSKMFHSSGPLGSFASKIWLAYLLKLVSEQAFCDLENMKKIRNLFAHDISIGSFEVPTVADRCKNFVLVDRYVSDPENGVHGNSAALFRYEVKNAAERLKNAKDRYVLSAQVISIGLQSGAGPGF